MKVQFQSEYSGGDFLFNHCIKTDQIPQNYLTHYHDMYELIFLKEGDISYLTENTIHSTRKNSLIFTRPGQLHRIRIDKNTPYDRYDLLIAPDAVDNSLLKEIPPDIHVVSFDSNPIMIQLFDKLDLYCEQLKGERLDRILRHLAQEVLLQILLHTARMKQNESAGMNPITRQAITYIEDNLASLTGVDAICREIGVSKSYLYRLFQNDLNTTPKNYLMERRLTIARQEIILGAKASAVYTQCGFSDYSTFFRAYKRHFGYPPSGTHHASFVRTSEDDFFKGYTE